jgi:hypothetical protein
MRGGRRRGAAGSSDSTKKRSSRDGGRLAMDDKKLSKKTKPLFDDKQKTKARIQSLYAYVGEHPRGRPPGRSGRMRSSPVPSQATVVIRPAAAGVLDRA